MPRQTIRIINKYGLHVRVAQRIAQEARGFDARVLLIKDGRTVDATDLLEVLTLGAPMGASLDVEASGAEADRALEAVAAVLQAPAEEIIGTSAEAGRKDNPDGD